MNSPYEKVILFLKLSILSTYFNVYVLGRKQEASNIVMTQMNEV